MAVKFSQFSNTSPTATTYLVGFDGTTNVKISYSSLLSGTSNYVTKWGSPSGLVNSQIFDNGTNVGVGTNLPSYKLDVAGSFRINYTSSTPSTAQVLINPSLTSTANFQSFRVVQINPTWSNAFGNTNIYAFEAYKNARFYDEFNGLQLTIDSNNVTVSTSIRVGGLQLYNDNRLYYPAAGFRLNFSNSDRALLTSGGNFIIATSPVDAGFRLDVSGTSRVSDVFHANNSAIGFGAVRVRETSTGYGVVVHPNASTSTYTQYNASSITFWNGSVATTISQISGSLYNDVNSANAIYNRFSNNHVFTITSGGASVGASSLNASAVLEATSTTKGFLPPRMTNAQMTAIGTPAAGLVVYDTTNNKLSVYNGSAWIAVH
jgi:hypothetical protein